MNKFIGWGGAGLLGLLAGLLWINRSGAPPQRWGFTNGASLRLVGVTYGTNHMSPLAWPWEPWADRLPKSLARLLPASGWMARLSSHTPSLAVWLQSEGDLSGLPEHWTLDDGASAVVRADRPTHWSGPSHRGLLLLHFTAWPRRPEVLNLRLWNPGRWIPGNLGDHPDQRLAEFGVQNPRPMRRAVSAATVVSSGAGAGVTDLWLPADRGAQSVEGAAQVVSSRLPRAPQTVREGDLEFTLTQFQYGLRGRGGGVDTETNGAFALGELRFAVTRQGAHAPGWFPILVHAEDAIGNRLRLSLGSTWFNAPRFHPAPWPGEAWRLRVEFSRNTHFTDGELVTLPAMPLAESFAPDFTWRTNFNGVTLERVSLTDRSPPPLQGLPSPPNEWVLRVDATGVPQGTYVTLHRLIVDSDYDGWREPRGGSLTERRLVFRFRPGRHAKSVTPILAVHRSRFVTFVAEPEDLRQRSR